MLCGSPWKNMGGFGAPPGRQSTFTGMTLAASSPHSLRDVLRSEHRAAKSLQLERPAPPIADPPDLQFDTLEKWRRGRRAWWRFKGRNARYPAHLTTRRNCRL